MRKVLFYASAVVFVCPAFTQTIDPAFWDTNGAVNSFATYGDTVILGGYFTYAGPFSGAALPVDGITGEVAVSFDLVDSDVTTVLSDGQGGWYVGGTTRGSICANPYAFVRHVLPDRTIDPAVQLEGTRYSRINDLAFWEGQLIIAGNFDTLQSAAFDHLARYDTSTHVLSGFSNEPDAPAQCLEVIGDTLYIGGQFAQLGNYERMNLAALDLTDGSVLDWYPGMQGLVYAMAASSSHLFVSGEFVPGGGQVTEFLVSADLLTGDTTGGTIDVYGLPRALAVAGDTLFMGGGFTEVLGVARDHFAAVHIPTTSVLPLDIGLGNTYYARIWALAITPDRIYVGGTFDTVMTALRENVASIDRSTGTLLPWAPTTGDEVFALGASGNDVIIGGSFHIANGERRRGICAYRMSTGELLPWAPHVKGGVNSMEIRSGTLYVGGNFSEVDGQARQDAAAFDLSTGQLTAWAPQIDDGEVKTLAVSDNTVYLGGTFHSVQGVPRERLAGTDPNSGALSPWDPGMQFPSSSFVGDIELWNDTVIIGGQFSMVGGVAHNGLAALDPVNGAPLAWAPTAGTDLIIVRGLLRVEGGIIAVGNHHVNGTYRSVLAFEFPNGQGPLPWDPQTEGQLFVAERLDNAIYLGGYISGISGIPMQNMRVIAVEAATGTYNPDWQPEFNGDCANVVAIEPTPTKIFLGATYGNRSATGHRHFMVVSLPLNMSIQEGGTGVGSLLVYPNPAHHQLTVVLPDNRLDTWRALILDPTGRTVRDAGTIRGSSATIDLRNLRSGTYVLRLISDERMAQTAAFVLE